MRLRLTDAKIKGLKPEANRRIIFGENGLGVRISTQGKKSFVYQYRFHGKSRLMTIGEYPNLTLALAHEKLANAKVILDEGKDPGKISIDKKIFDKQAFTVSELADEYIEQWAKKKKKTWQEDQRCLNKDFLPFVGMLKAKDIERREIILTIDKIVERGSEAMANRTLNVVCKMFRFAVQRDIIKSSPANDIPLPAKKTERDRILNDSEIRQFWSGLNDYKSISINNKLLLKFLLVTGQRRGETASATWEEFDLKTKLWEIPADKAKNGILHIIPLNDMAMELLQEIKTNSANSIFLFPSYLDGRPINPRATTKSLSKFHKDMKMNHFTPHDLRRTVATIMTGEGVPRLTVSKILNHSEGGMTRIYDRYDYAKEKRQAVEIWERKLRNIIFGEKAKIINLSTR